MTYTFKLSRRLAISCRVGRLLLPLVVLACGRPDTTDFLAPPPNTLTALVLSPKNPSAAPGDVVQFSIIGQSRAGNVDVTGKVVWSTSSAGATVADDGRFVAVTPGSYTVRARHRDNPSLADSTVVTVDARLTVAAVVIVPKQASLLPGEGLKFRAEAYLSNGQATTDGLTFRAPGGGLISSDGQFQAPSVSGRTYTVIAEAGGQSDTSIVNVTNAPPVLTQFILNPSGVTMQPGEDRQFTVSALWSDGSTTVPTVTLSSSGGTISSSGLFTAGSTPGDFMVFARQAGGGRTDTAHVNIQQPTITQLELTPSAVTLLPGATQAFQAKARMSDGSLRAVGVTYTAHGGSITTGGVYTAGAGAGTWPVIATVPGVGASDTSLVTISTPAAAPQSVTISPKSVTTPAGVPVQFTATGTWPGGTTASPNVSWIATSGTVSSAGLFTSSTPGTARVIVRTPDGSRSDTATVTVGARALTRLIVSPDTASVLVNGTLSFSAQGVWSDGTTDVSQALWSATGGTIGATGTFVAGTATGTFRVIGRTSDGTLADTSLVTVTAVAPTLLRITLYPDTLSLNPGETRQLTVGAQWTAGGSGAPQVNYSATGGTITSAGLYTAGTTAGTYRIIATAQGGLSDTSTVRILAPVVTRVVLTPPTVTLQTGTTAQFTATATWSDGVIRTTPITFSATGGTITAQGLYSAGNVAGSFLVIAACSCGRADSSVATITAALPPPPPAATGSIAVTVGGLPTGTAAQVVVTGPNGFTRALTGSAVVDSLPAGNFTVGALGVTVSPDFYVPAPLGQTITVASGARSNASVTYSRSGTSGQVLAHPRIILDGAALQALRQKVASNEATWLRLKARCDYLLTQDAQFPDGAAWAPLGQGYYGDNYRHQMGNLGVCYQAVKLSNPTLAAAYGAKGADLLNKMTDSAHVANPLGDSGYGIRFYGVALGLGYDWLYDALTPTLRTRVWLEVNRWLNAFATGGLTRNGPGTANYFIGYYAAQAVGSVATEGENPQAPTLWADWLNRLHGQIAQPYISQYLRGGGWSEGWQYGVLTSENYTLGVLTALTGKGVNLVAGGFTFPLEQGMNAIHASWPGGAAWDDRGTFQLDVNPTATKPRLFDIAGYAQRRFGGANAGVLQSFGRVVRQQPSVEPAEEWEDALFWDESASSQDYATLPRSYQSAQTLLMRSDWSNDATWASYAVGPYLGEPGHPSYDKGSLTVMKGMNGLLVNGTGWLLRQSPEAGTAVNAVWGWVYDNNYSTTYPRSLHNTFLNGPEGQWSYGPESSTTSYTGFEDAESYVRWRGVRLEQMFRSVVNISGWTRDVVYLRPNRFVIYDRTQVAVDQDQQMHFHLGRTPQAVGANRWDVTANRFVGSLTSLLPANPRFSVVDVFSQAKVFEVQVRPASGSGNTQRWLHVVDASGSASAVANASRLTLEDGNLTVGNFIGALLDSQSSAEVVLFGRSLAPAVEVGPIAYRVPDKQTHHVISDLTPSGAYSVAVVVAGGTQTVTVTPGGSLRASANGVLSFVVASSGSVSAGN